MLGLELSNLSSNWKKLQQTLKSDKSKDQESASIKRRRPDESNGSAKRAATSNSIKRQKTDSALGNKFIKKRTMGTANSIPDPSTATNAPRRSNSRTSLSAFAAHSSLSNPVAAYGSSGAIKPAPSADVVNEGLNTVHKPGKYLALDCEMVGTGPPPSLDNVLARVSIVNYHGEQIYDSFVLPLAGVEITDYRTFVSGIRPQYLRPGYARPFAEVQKDVATLLEDRVLVGHALKNDMAALLLSHPKRSIRDTARYPEFRKLSMGKAPALRKLAKELLGLEIQAGEHSSLEDARATMALFRKEKVGFEKEAAQRYGAVTRRIEKEKVKQTDRLHVSQSARSQESDMEEDDEDEDEMLDEEEEDESEDEGGEGGVKPTKNKKKKKKKHKKRTKR